MPFEPSLINFLYLPKDEGIHSTEILKHTNSGTESTTSEAVGVNVRHIPSCSCSNFVSPYTDHGDCKKAFSKYDSLSGKTFSGPVCFVNEPSTCTDLRMSKNLRGKQYSWEACNHHRSK